MFGKNPNATSIQTPPGISTQSMNNCFHILGAILKVPSIEIALASANIFRVAFVANKIISPAVEAPLIIDSSDSSLNQAESISKSA